VTNLAGGPRLELATVFHCGAGKMCAEFKTNGYHVEPTWLKPGLAVVSQPLHP